MTEKEVKIKKSPAELVRLIVIIVFICGICWLIWVFVDGLTSSDANVRTTLIGIVATVSLGIAAHYHTKRREIEAHHFLERTKGYSHMINAIFRMMMSVKDGETVPDSQSRTWDSGIVMMHMGRLVHGSANAMSPIFSDHTAAL